MLIASYIYSEIAVLQIWHNSSQPQRLKPLVLGKSPNQEVGDTVVVIGNPFGLSDTICTGIVSEIGRSLPTSAGFSIPNVIQSDAPVNPGNSGGPLFDTGGEMIGIYYLARIPFLEYDLQFPLISNKNSTKAIIHTLI